MSEHEGLKKPKEGGGIKVRTGGIANQGMGKGVGEVEVVSWFLRLLIRLFLQGHQYLGQTASSFSRDVLW